MGWCFYLIGFVGKDCLGCLIDKPGLVFRLLLFQLIKRFAFSESLRFFYDYICRLSIRPDCLEFIILFVALMMLLDYHRHLVDSCDLFIFFFYGIKVKELVNYHTKSLPLKILYQKVLIYFDLSCKDILGFFSLIIFVSHL